MTKQEVQGGILEGQLVASFSIPRNTEEIGPTHMRLSLLLQKMGWDNREAEEICLAFDEILSNIITHNIAQIHADIDVTFILEPSRAEITIRHYGESFDLNTLSKEVDMLNSKTSGRGMAMVYKLVDSVEYSSDGKIVTLVKKRTLSD